jgi:hypothetical protein
MEPNLIANTVRLQRKQINLNSKLESSNYGCNLGDSLNFFKSLINEIKSVLIK